MNWRFILATFLLISQVLDLTGQIDPCNFKYRKRITFDPTKVSGSADLTNFPALIYISSDNDLRTTANSGHVDNANGYDIVFTAADGVTQLDQDLNSYDATTGSLVCWVKIPTLSASINTYIYMYYGSTLITTDQSSSSTWSNGFVGVYHFDNSVNNSSPTSNMNGTNNGSTNTATSKYGSARNFASASSHYVDVTPYNSAYDLNADVTVTAWIRIASTGADQKIAGNQNGSTGGWKFGVFSDNKIEFEIRTSGGSPFLSRSAAGGSALSSNTWYYVAGNYSDAGNYIKTYLNGALDRNYGTTASAGTSNGTMKFGREPFASSAYMNGIIDELRISNVSRTAGWIATEYANQNSPSTFYSISSEPKLWTAGSSGNWNTNGNWTPSGTPNSGQDVIIKNDVPARQPTLNTSVQLGALWIHPGATLNGGSAARTFSIGFDITNCGVFTGSTGLVVLNTTTIQTQYVAGTGTYNLNNLTIDTQFNIDPQVEFTNTVNIAGALTLNSGIVKTSTTGLPILGNSATSSSGSSQSFIHGPMRKTGTANFVFPVGKGQEWRRIGISSVSAATTFQAEYFTNAYTNTSTITSPLFNVSIIEYWQLDRIAGTGNAKVSLYWENVSYSGIDDCPDLTVARWNGASWVEHTAATVAGSGCSGAGTGTVSTSAVVTAFSPFTFGSHTGSVNVLPVEISDFTASCDKEGAIELNWTTMSEIRDDYFAIESGGDGITFREIGRVKATGGNSGKQNYTYTDHSAKESTAYYRLRQVDSDGQFSYFKVAAANCAMTKNELSVFPNPTSDGSFTILGLQPGTILRVYSDNGSLIDQITVSSNRARTQLSTPGIYLLQATSGDRTFSSKVIVK
jgi:hypothetical protein